MYACIHVYMYVHTWDRLCESYRRTWETPMRCRGYETPIVIRAADTAYICDFPSSWIGFALIEASHTRISRLMSLWISFRARLRPRIRRRIKARTEWHVRGRTGDFFFFFFFFYEREEIFDRASSGKGMQIATRCPFPSILSAFL